MPATKPQATAAHPAEGFRSVALPSAPNRPLRVYLPTDYQPKYAYPLVVLFHDAGECEERAARLVPLLSRRNYVAACVRGPVALGRSADGRPGFGWRDAADRGTTAALAHALDSYSVHPDRVFLVGVGAGASVAYRLAAVRRVAGVVALNGAPAGRAPAGLRVLVAHGTASAAVPFPEAREGAARLRAAGASVRVARYAASHRLRDEMLRDANTWIMEQVIGGKRQGRE